MPDAPAKTGGKSSFGFLTRKLGFMPVWGWGLAAFGGYYWYTHFGPGKKAAAAQTVTDPAGNTCSALAPSGFCPGSAEDMAANQTQTMPAGSSDGGLPVPPMPPVPGQPPPGPTGPPVKPPPRKRPPAQPPPRLIGPPVRQPPIPVRPPPRPTPRPGPIPPGPTGPPVIAPPPRSQPLPVPEPRPVPVTAPMTSGGIYGGVPVSRIDGTTYDSGYPSDAQMGGVYVPAG